MAAPVTMTATIMKIGILKVMREKDYRHICIDFDSIIGNVDAPGDVSDGNV
jgi:hypothetical protein